MDRALADRIEQQVRQAFPEGAIMRAQVLQYGDDPGFKSILATCVALSVTSPSGHPCERHFAAAGPTSWPRG